MKKLISIFSLIFLGFAFVTAAEDLGALSKKEKERREAVAKEGKQAKTYTNADIQNLKATLAIEITTTGQTTESTPTNKATAAEPETTTDNDAEIEKLKQEKEQLEQQAKESRENVGRGGVFFTPNIGSQYQQAREAEDKAAKIDEKINKLQKEKEEAGAQE